MFIFSLSHMGMAVLLLGGQVIDSKMGTEWMGKEPPPFPSSLLDLNLYPLNHINFPRILWLVTELCISTRISKGEDWHNINHPPSNMKDNDWALNEGC